MNILINALSTTNMSGRHVLLGHLRQLIRRHGDCHRFQVLIHCGNADMMTDLGTSVEWISCPAWTSRWFGRSIWERMVLPGVSKKHNIDFIFHTSGFVAYGTSAPQVSYAMNPWCLVPSATTNTADKFKALMQRIAYARAARKADGMIFLSDFLRRAYRENAGGKDIKSIVAYCGIDDDVFSASKSSEAETRQRRRHQILSVSAWAPHKNAEALVHILDRLRRHHRIPARLLLVGPWTVAGYESSVRSLVGSLELDEHVSFVGHVPASDLHKYYMESALYCLMSRCESFGIPALEGQAFGTPVVCSNNCAAPEICGDGGLYCDSDDIKAASAHIANLMNHDTVWQEKSLAAQANAANFHWDQCSKPLDELFDWFRLQ